jgi:hypothetical protein
VSEYTVLRRIFGPMLKEVKQTGENCIMWSFMPLTKHHEDDNPQEELGAACSMCQKRTEKHTAFFWRNPTARDSFKSLAIHGLMILR